ncbi:DEAD/DEAH box helicase [Paenibacillus sp. Root52]|uniref:Superfamily II DNA/RNA helicase n=1 Tax=Paenibacillus amylolyticus TaxID=1451 RepID=A0AAP5H2Z5_PAEAM|nr:MULTISPECIES: DEAD/DEAH box helicase [Paenibacillus]KQY80697.1 DEAD/DEAH box helicase [Paenibacillus sp. Root52]MDR6724932.1 superfamily II DNA/RNA helicase [Paenibacillus amylolyticus]
MTNTFASIGVAEDLEKVLAGHGINEPSPVQAQTIPVILEGRDVVAKSQTGTGKTLAYLLPLLQTIKSDVKGTQKLIIAPTQELAMQIVREAQRYGEERKIGVLGLIGGAAVKRQIEKLREHPALVVGTPGRLKELITLKKLKMHNVSTIVIDEADQVFQLGGVSDVDFVLRSALRDRQLIFLSATIDEHTAGLAKREMKEPVHIGIEPERATAAGLEHFYFVEETRNKIDMLRRLVRQYNPDRAIVFVNATEDIGEVEAKMNHLGLSAAALYGDADKVTRSNVLSAFRNGKIQLLIASEVAARGLDIEGLPMVINYDPAFDSEYYVHRAGRTGRMGRSGIVLSIVDETQIFIMRKFARELGIELTERVLFGGKVLEADPRPDTRPEGHSFSRKPGSAKGRKPGQATRNGGARAVISNQRDAGNKPAGNTGRTDRNQDRKNKGAPKWSKGNTPRSEE